MPPPPAQAAAVPPTAHFPPIESPDLIPGPLKKAPDFFYPATGWDFLGSFVRNAAPDLTIRRGLWDLPCDSEACPHWRRPPRDSPAPCPPLINHPQHTHIISASLPQNSSLPPPVQDGAQVHPLILTPFLGRPRGPPILFLSGPPSSLPLKAPATLP